MEQTMTIKTAVVLVVAASSTIAGLLPAQAQEFRKIDGEYIVTGTGATSEFGLILRGQAAKELYLAMPFKATADACTGGVKKVDPKGLFCIKQSNEFTCSMGLVLKTRKVTSGPLTC